MESDKISIIVPIYNAGKFLPKCLASLSSQTYKNIEIVLIDDGSIDNSAEICKSFCEADSRFIYVYQENAGVSAARNKGVSISSGEYICFCDSDDWVDPDIYECLYKLITENNVDMACCAFVIENNGRRLDAVDDEEVYIFKAKEALCDIVFNGKRVGGIELWTKIFKRGILDRVKFREGISIGEDAVMMFETLLVCDSVAYSRKFKYHYVYNEVSATNSKFKDSYWTIQKSSDIIYEKTKLHFPNNVYLAERMIILSGLSIAEKLCNFKMLNLNNYKRIKGWIAPHCNRKSIKALSKRRKISYKLFNFSRLFYIIYRKFINSKLFQKLK